MRIPNIRYLISLVPMLCALSAPTTALSQNLTEPEFLVLVSAPDKITLTNITSVRTTAVSMSTTVVLRITGTVESPDVSVTDSSNATVQINKGDTVMIAFALDTANQPPADLNHCRNSALRTMQQPDQRLFGIWWNNLLAAVDATDNQPITLILTPSWACNLLSQ